MTKKIEEKKDYKDKYNQATKIPVFTPDPEKRINIEDTVNIDKYLELVEEIAREYENHNITEIQKKFLILAAARWVQWNYADVAQYYACLKPDDPMKRLLERSAMVLIDVDKAFELGVIKSQNFIVNVTKKYIEDNPERMKDYDVNCESGYDTTASVVDDSEDFF